MLVVREIFTAKPGQATKLANLFKKVMPERGTVRVLTDYIGDFNTVVIETEVKNLAEFEQQVEKYRSGEAFKGMDPEAVAAMSKYTELFQSGRREVMRVVE